MKYTKSGFGGKHGWVVLLAGFVFCQSNLFPIKQYIRLTKRKKKKKKLIK